MSDILRCLVADDEPLAVKGMENLIRQVPYLEIVGTCSNAFETLHALGQHSPDLLFLDIQMPGMTGIELLRTLRNPPLTIITSAYQKYALEGYELDIIDYLVKPVSPERFIKSVAKAQEFFRMRERGAQQPEGEDFFFIKCDGRYEKIFFDDLLYVESLKNYIVLHTQSRKLISYVTLKTAEDYLPKDSFLKVHKSFIVAIDKIAHVQPESVHVGNVDIPISRQNRDEIMQTILGDKVMRR